MKTVNDKTKQLKTEMRGMVYTEFRDRTFHGVIVVSIEEMTNVFTNLLAEFIEFSRLKEQSLISQKEKI